MSKRKKCSKGNKRNERTDLEDDLLHLLVRALELANQDDHDLARVVVRVVRVHQRDNEADRFEERSEPFAAVLPDAAPQRTEDGVEGFDSVGVRRLGEGRKGERADRPHLLLLVGQAVRDDSDEVVQVGEHGAPHQDRDLPAVAWSARRQNERTRSVVSRGAGEQNTEARAQKAKRGHARWSANARRRSTHLLADFDPRVPRLPREARLAHRLKEGEERRHAERGRHDGEGARRRVAHVLVEVVDVRPHRSDHRREACRGVVSSKMLGGASQTVSQIRVECNGT